MPRHATSSIRSATTPRRCQSSSTGWAAKSPSSRAQVATSLFSRVDGKLFVDAGVTATRPRILAAVLGRETPHWRFDHTDGNKWLNREGAAAARAVRDWQPDEVVLLPLYPQYSTTTTGLLAHENTHKHLLSPQSAEDWEFNFPSPPLSAVPTEGGGRGRAATILRARRSPARRGARQDRNPTARHDGRKRDAAHRAPRRINRQSDASMEASYAKTLVVEPANRVAEMTQWLVPRALPWWPKLTTTAQVRLSWPEAARTTAPRRRCS